MQLFKVICELTGKRPYSEACHEFKNCRYNKRLLLSLANQMSFTLNNRIGFSIIECLQCCWLGHVECSSANYCEGLSKHAHFRNFGMAFLTLFRVATGDNWNGIMKVWNLNSSRIP